MGRITEMTTTTTTTVTSPYYYILDHNDLDILCDKCRVPMSLEDLEACEFRPVMKGNSKLTQIAERLYECSICSQNKKKLKLKNEKRRRGQQRNE